MIYSLLTNKIIKIKMNLYLFKEFDFELCGVLDKEKFLNPEIYLFKLVFIFSL